MPKRQTQTFLRALFRERGLKPKNKLGQSFLVDLNLIDYIVKQAELTRDDMVLEVGAGTGSLTAQLAQHAGAVLSVEVDRDFYALARETLGPPAHVQLVLSDILKNKNQLNPQAVTPLADGWRRFGEQGGKHLKLVSNLPYAVATPVLANLLLSDLPFERLVVTVQWEIAERLVAWPGTKNFGALTVLVQSLADVELLRKLQPAVFWPRPQVSSAIVRIWPRAKKRAQIRNVQRFREFLRDLYAHRRKNLRGALVNLPDKPFDKSEVDRKLAELGIDGNSRAETLDRHVHLRLCDAFSSQVTKQD
ncbi:MAG: 16S rRNA (adenine(1518)-N(6)/adenine(1519)-N(6))-dimethyltransferase RsmA [Gemmataceae bacterium]|nr:16S rRNA (adenine(1518)-N(6)/adenine(1519)-N(6))-dimethyltransferase RsmA [Gemmataceae bacterium]MCI0740745.1 16S rRNA (adenine(1518)-N(6)/adenine(1519)-N(6))-dimethyltransferase RsmA [Gemmataceae bacterium]